MQGPLLQDDLWEQEIVPRLPQDLDEQAKALGALRRKRGLKQAQVLLRAILSWVLCQRSLRQLGAWAVVLGLADLCEKAWRKRLAQCGEWLIWLVQSALAGSRKADASGRRVLLVDGTELTPPGGKGQNGWLVQLTYDVGAATLLDVRVGDPHQAESLLGLPLREGDCLLNDRGLTRRAGIMQIAEQKAFQLGRWSQTAVRLQQQDGAALQVDDWLVGLPAEAMIVERPALCVQDSQVVPLRLLALRLPPEQAAKAQARLNKQARRKCQKVRESTLRLACWVILVSTLPADFSASELFWLYRCRWQIERLIKAMKQLLPLVQLRCQKPEMIRTTLLAWILAWIWQEAAVQEIVRQMQQPCGELAQLQEEYRQLQTLWEREEERLAQTHGVMTNARVSECNQEPIYLQSASPAPSALSRWVISCCSLQWWQSVVQGQWRWQRVLDVLPRLLRFFCPSPRRRRCQRLQLEAWLRLRLANPPGFSVPSHSSFP